MPSHRPDNSRSSVGRIYCHVCKGKDHPIRRCKKFSRMNIVNKYINVEKYKYCFNCLAISHTTRGCTSKSRCSICGEQHHTLLHVESVDLLDDIYDTIYGGADYAMDTADDEEYRRMQEEEENRRFLEDEEYRQLLEYDYRRIQMEDYRRTEDDYQRMEEYHRMIAQEEYYAKKKAAAAANAKGCRLCSANHALRKCTFFKEMTPDERLEAVHELDYCVNCLSNTHLVKDCISSARCRHCNNPHHSLLHRNAPPQKKSNDVKKVSTELSNDIPHLDVSRLLPNCCPMCRQKHTLRKCQAFLKLSIANRRDLINKNRFCFNCLAMSHELNKCESPKRCTICAQKHHSTLHEPNNVSRSSSRLAKEDEQQNVPIVEEPKEQEELENIYEQTVENGQSQVPEIIEIDNDSEYNYSDDNQVAQVEHDQNEEQHVPQEKRTPCRVCKSKHLIRKCRRFVSMPVQERIDLMEKLRCCKNCLDATHSTRNCKNIHRCNVCGKRHHSLLHKTTGDEPANAPLFDPEKFIKQDEKLKKKKLEIQGKVCRICNKTHELRMCKKFIAMTTSQRFKVVRTHRYCENCLGLRHPPEKCTSQHKCSYCGQKHHSMLHGIETYMNDQAKEIELVAPAPPNISGIPSMVPAPQSSLSSASHTNPDNCHLCFGVHKLMDCQLFLNMSVADRLETVQRLHQCSNCLAKTHSTNSCMLVNGCGICGHRHHTLLHKEKEKSSVTDVAASSHLAAAVQQTAGAKKSCILCNDGSHPIKQCKQFLKLNVSQRIQHIRQNNYCENCFAISHNKFLCTSIGRCRLCGGQHNSLLHQGSVLAKPSVGLLPLPTLPAASTMTIANTTNPIHFTSSSTSAVLNKPISEVHSSLLGVKPANYMAATTSTSTSSTMTNPLLSNTATMSSFVPNYQLPTYSSVNTMYDSNAATSAYYSSMPSSYAALPSNNPANSSYTLSNPSGVMPSSSTSSSIYPSMDIPPPAPPIISTTRIATLQPTVIVKLEYTEVFLRALLDPLGSISTVSSSFVNANQLKTQWINNKELCTFTVRSRIRKDFTMDITALVKKDFDKYCPEIDIDPMMAEYFSHLKLADPLFYQKNVINAIFDQEVYEKVMQPGLVPGEGLPMAQNTMFGWILTGSFGA